MADYAPNYSPRYVASYMAAGIGHSVMTRGPRGFSASDLVTNGAAVLGDIVNNLDSLLPTDFAWISAMYALTDSDVFLPTGTLPASIIGGVPTSSLTPVERITATTFIGRSTNSRVRITIYCPDWDQEAPSGLGERGVVQASEVGGIAASITALNNPIHQLSGVDGTMATFYPYVNVKTNDALLRKVRRGL